MKSWRQRQADLSKSSSVSQGEVEDDIVWLLAIVLIQYVVGITRKMD